MAQYFQVLSQSDKPADELRQFFNNQIQYVINPDDQQQDFREQQILVTSEPLMIVDGQQQITYQAQPQHQYIVKEGATIEYADSQEQPQQVFYMETSDDPEHSNHAVVEQQQPVILNSMQQQITVPAKNVTIRQQLAPQLPQQMLQTVRQIHPQVAQIQQQRPIQVPTIQQLQQQQQQQQQQVGLQMLVQQQQLNVQQPQQQVQLVKEEQEAVALADGTIVTLAEYNSIVASQKTADDTVVIDESKIASPKQKVQRNCSPNRRLITNRGGRGRIGLTPQFPLNHSCVQQQLQQQQQRLQAQPRQLLQQRQQLQQMRPQIPQMRHQAPQLRQQMPQPRQQLQPRCVQQVPNQPTPQRLLTQQQQRPVNHIIQPQRVRQKLKQVNPSTPQKTYKLSDQIRQIVESNPLSSDNMDSIRMLILLSNGEQRLITFELPKEACSIYEILEQVGVPYSHDTQIEVQECIESGIHYVVTVGDVPTNQFQEVIKPDSPKLVQSSPPVSAEEIENVNSKTLPQTAVPEQPKDTPKYVPGMLAVCSHCGYLSEDFNKCLRCKRKLPEDIKSMPSSINVNKMVAKRNDLRCNLRPQEKKLPTVKSNGSEKLAQAAKKRTTKPKLQDTEPVILTLSSDEEDNSSPVKKSTEEQLPKSVNPTVSLSAIRKEPSLKDIEQGSVGTKKDLELEENDKEHDVFSPEIKISLVCRTIRIGTYKYVPSETLDITSSGLTLKIPHPKDQKKIIDYTIRKSGIVKVLANFQKILPVIFYYVKPSYAAEICEKLDLKDGTELFFSPISSNEAYRRITVLPQYTGEDTKRIFEQIYTVPGVMEELSTKEANELLIKSCPKDAKKSIMTTSITEIKQLFIYPPTKGGVPINTEDYVCLAQDQFLNDVIIEFYIKYLVLNLPKEKQEKVHVFSSFFYKRLTSKPLMASRRAHPTELDPNLTPAQKRHSRVKNWTKNVNLFEKDFIIVPINENAHWFLAIICFPNLDGPVTIDGKPLVLPKQKQETKSVNKSQNVKVKEVEEPVSCDPGDGSDKDEAEGEDSDLDPDEDSAEEAPPQPDLEKRPAIKQPCILIFDSLSGASRSRVVATLRDYLTCEYKAKLGTEKIFNKDVIKGSCPKVPQQTNFTDCGLYLLQYVEHFFNDPIVDYHIPIKQLKNWFDEFTVTKKREDISLLIKDLMRQYDKDPDVLPDISFPTLNGKLVPRVTDEEEEEEDEEAEEELDNVLNKNDPDEKNASQEMSQEDDEGADDSICSTQANPSNSFSNDDFEQHSVDNPETLKPDNSEVQKQQSNRDTMSYLKSKRIIRHKHNESDGKKLKLTE